MANKPALNAIMSMLGLLESKNKNASPQSKKKDSATSEYLMRSREIEALSTRLDQLLAHRDDVGGHMFLLDFSNIKKRLGPKWETAAERIHGKISAVIQNHLSPHDLHFRKDDETYMVIFPTLGEHEGQLKSSIIAEHVAEALVGSESMSSLFKVQTVTSGKDGKLVSHDTPPISSLLERVSERLKSMPVVPEQEASASGSTPALREAEQLVVSGGAKKTKELPQIPEFGYVFRPLLSVKTKVISTFLCIPVRETTPGHFVSGYQVLGPGAKPDEYFALDMKSVVKVSKELWGLSTSKKRSLLALPVHFETLADQNKRRAYAALCQDKFQDMSNRIIFEINGLPEGVPQPRILEFVSALRPISRAVIARFSADHKGFPAYRAAGLHAVGIDVYESLSSETKLMKHMDTFIQNARAVQLKTYIEGVRSLSIFTAAITNGFDYLAGYALSGVVGNAEDIQEFKLDSLYLSLLQDLDRLPKS